MRHSLNGIREVFFRLPKGRFCGSSFTNDNYVFRGVNQPFVLSKGLPKDSFNPVPENGISVFSCHYDTQTAVVQGRRFEDKLISRGMDDHILGVPFRKIRPFSDMFFFFKGFSLSHHTFRRRDVFSPLPGAGL